MSAYACSRVMPLKNTASSAISRCRPVSIRSGSRLLMVTLDEATSRDSPLDTDVSPVRAACDSAIGECGVFTIAEVMLTIRPNSRSTMPGSASRMSSSGASMLASIAAIQSSRSHWSNIPGCGPELLVTRIPGSGQTSKSADRVEGSPISPWTVVTVTPVSSRSWAAAASSRSASRPLSVTCTPSLASERAQAKPRPELEAATMACCPAIPRSIRSPGPRAGSGPTG